MNEQLFLCSEDNKVLYAWPYCQTCHQPFDFDAEEPLSYCKCGTGEWGYPRPAEWIPNPHKNLTTDPITRGWPKRDPMG